MTSAAVSESIVSRWRICMAAAVEVFDHGAARLRWFGHDVARADWRLAVTARNVEHVGWLAQPGIAAAQGAHHRLALANAGAEMPGAGRKIAMMQVVRLDAALDEGPHQLAQGLGIVIDAAQQHALAQHRDAGIDEPGAGRARGAAHFARMVGM